MLALDAVAAETGATLLAIALAWLGVQPGIAAPIASARSPKQLAALLESTKLELTIHQLQRLSTAA